MLQTRSYDGSKTTVPETFEDAWQRLGEALEARADVFVKEVMREITRQPSYRHLNLHEVRPAVKEHVAELLGRLRYAPQPLTAAEEAVFRTRGHRRAEQGVSVDELVRIWRLLIDLIREQVHRVAPEGPHRDLALVRMLKAVDEIDGGVLALVAGYQEADEDRLQHEFERSGEILRAFLFAQAPDTQVQARADTHGFDPNGSFHAVRMRLSTECDLHQVEQLFDRARRGGRPNAMLGLIEGDVCGFAASLPADFEFGTVAVSAPVSLVALPEAFRLATRALQTASILKLRGMVDMVSLGVDPAVFADADVGAGLMERYVDPFQRMGDSGTAILDTVERLLENNGKLAPTARDLHVHVNTVRYRVARYEEMINGSIRDTHRIIEVWWALRRRRMLASCSLG